MLAVVAVSAIVAKSELLALFVFVAINAYIEFYAHPGS